MADTEEDGEVLSEGELEEGELLSSDEEEVSERSPAAKHAAPEPAKPPKVDKSPRAAKRPAAEPEAAGAAALKVGVVVVYELCLIITHSKAHLQVSLSAAFVPMM